MYKPGYKTSEFWFTLVSFIFSGLFLLGLIGENDQKEELIQNVSHAVESCILIGGQLTILYKYIKSRSTVKEAYWNNKTPTAPTPTPQQKLVEVTNESDSKPRSNQRTSRKTNATNKRKPKRNKKDSGS